MASIASSQAEVVPGEQVAGVAVDRPHRRRGILGCGIDGQLHAGQNDVGEQLLGTLMDSSTSKPTVTVVSVGIE